MKSTITTNLNNVLPKKPTYEQALDFRKKQFAVDLAGQVKDKVELRANKFRANDQYRADIDKRPNQIQIGGPKAAAHKRTKATSLQILGKVGVVASIVSIPFAVAAAFAAPPLVLAPVVLAMASTNALARDSRAEDVGHLRYNHQGQIQSFEGENGDSTASIERDGGNFTYKMKQGKNVDNSATFRGETVEVTTKRELRDDRTMQLPELNPSSFEKHLTVNLDSNGNLPDPGKFSEGDARRILVAEKVMEVVGRSVGTLKASDQAATDLDTDVNRVVIAPNPDLHALGSTLYGGVLESDPETGSVSSAAGFQGTRSGYTHFGGGVSAYIEPDHIGKLGLRNEFAYQRDGAQETFLLNDYAVVKNGDNGRVTLYNAT